MCIPPIKLRSHYHYFNKIKELNIKNNLTELKYGYVSNDYKDAIKMWLYLYKNWFC